VGLPKFKGENFSVWRARVVAYLTAADIDYVLDSEKPRKKVSGVDAEIKTRDEEIERYEKADKKVMALLLIALDDKHAMTIMNCFSAKEAWERLCAIHEQKSSANKIVLQKEFFDLQMKPNESVRCYISRAENTYRQLLDVEVHGIEEDTLVSKIVSGLPRQYFNFMSNWSHLEPDKQTLVELIARLSAEEQLISKFRQPRVENAFLGHVKPKQHKQNSSQVRSRADTGRQTTKPKSVRPTTTGKSKPANSDEKNLCFYCKKEGHWINDCPKIKEKNRNNKSVNIAAEATTSGELDGGESAIVVESVALVGGERCWILDSGASSHISGFRADFSAYEKLETPRTVLLANQQKGYGIGLGEIKLVVKIDGQDKILKLKNVLHVPEIKRRLISIGAATDNGCKGIIENNKIKLIKNDQPQLVAIKRNGIYYVQVNEEENANAVESTDPLEMWHNRFGHINKRTILKMANEGHVEGLEEIRGQQLAKSKTLDTIDCESCQKRKMSKLTIPLSTRTRSTRVGEVVHSDICGPLGKTSISGANYIVLFKDEASNYRFIYCVKTREETFECLKKTYARILADTNNKMLTLVTDCGSEYISIRTQLYLSDHNVVHRKSIPFVPAQNGFVERENRTISEGVRSMLFASNMPLYFWSEAATTFVYLLNRSLNKNIDKTPYEYFFKEKPRISFLRPFGCLAYVKTQTKKRSGYQQKLEERAQKGALLGYDRDYTYRVYLLEERKIILSRDIAFDETKFPYAKCATEPVHDLTPWDDDPDEIGDDDDANVQEEEGPQVDESDQAEPARYNLRSRTTELSNLALIEPNWLTEALSSPEASKWLDAATDEYNSLIANNTWELVELPKGRKPITCKWVFKLKMKGDEIARYKCRLVARGFTQQFGIDYSETFSPVARLETVRIILNLANHFDLITKQFDVKTAFLHGGLQEEIYMKQPEGFQQGENLVCRLRKSIYGLKQASRNWNATFTDFLKKFALRNLLSDTCVFINDGFELGNPSKPILIICLYVDDGLVATSSKELLEKCIIHLESKFEITSGDLDNFVGIQVERNATHMYLHQSVYIDKTLDRFKMADSKYASTPMRSDVKYTATGVVGVESKSVDVPYRQCIGALLYLATGTRPDISFAVNVLSRYSNNPRLVHWNGVKHLLRYLNHHRNYMILYHKDSAFMLEGFSDSDFAGCHDKRKSTTGLVLLLNNSPVVWKSARQTLLATSTCEAEYISASTCAKEIKWVRSLLEELKI